MKHLRLHLHRGLSYTLSWSLAFAPVATLAPVTYAVAQTDNSAQESLESQTTELTARLEALLDRQLFPDVPRRGRTGEPSPSDLGEITILLRAAKKAAVEELSQVLASFDEDNVSQMLRENPKAINPLQKILERVSSYYETATKFEYLKIVRGEHIDPLNYDRDYGLQIEAKNVSQAAVLDILGLFSRTGVILPLPGYDLMKLAQQASRSVFFTTNMLRGDDGKTYIFLTLDKSFIANAERMAMIARPSLKSSLQYAAHFSLHALYESEIQTRALLQQSVATLPEPPPGARERWLSFRLSKEAAQLNWLQRAYQTTKVQVFKEVMDTAESSGRYVLSPEFFAQLNQITKIPYDSNTPQKNKEIQESTLRKFGRAFGGLLNMSRLNGKPEQLRELMTQGMRATLRTLFVHNKAAFDRIGPEVKPQVEAFLDKTAAEYVEAVLAHKDLSPMYARAAKDLIPRRFAQRKLDFQLQLEKDARKIRNFPNTDVKPEYLVASKSATFKDIAPSEWVSGIIQKIAKAGSYQEAYAGFKLDLLVYLNNFNLDGQPLSKGLKNLSLRQIEKLAHLRSRFMPRHHDRLQFDGKSLDREISPENRAELNPPAEPGFVERLIGKMSVIGLPLRKAWGTTPSDRQKDLEDLIRIGQALHFDIYDENPSLAPTLKNLKFDVGGISLGAEAQRYVEEYRRDALSKQPLLGSMIQEYKSPESPEWIGVQQTELWRRLVDKSVSASSRTASIDEQLTNAQVQVTKNQREIDAQLDKIDAIKDRDVSGLSSDLILLFTRAGQISISLKEFDSFESFYSDMQNELLAASFLEREWKTFVERSNHAMPWLIAFALLQASGRAISVNAALAGNISKLLAPFFGPNLRYLNTVLTAMIGITIVDSGVRGFGTEANRAGRLQSFYESTSDAPRLVTYRDLSMQREIMTFAQNEAISNIQMVLMFTGAVWGVGYLAGKAKMLGRAFWIELQKDMATAGLSPLKYGADPRTLLEASNVRNAVSEARAVAQGHANSNAAAMGDLYVQAAYARLESNIKREGARWAKVREEFADTIRQEKLQDGWYNPQDIRTATGNLIDSYRRGEISRTTYDERLNRLVLLSNRVGPVWTEMQAYPDTRAFYLRVFDEASGSSRSLTRAASTFDAAYSARFMREMEALYTESAMIPTLVQVPNVGGRAQEQILQFVWRQTQRPTNFNGRLTKMLDRVADEVRNEPLISKARAKQLTDWIRQGVRQ